MPTTADGPSDEYLTAHEPSPAPVPRRDEVLGGPSGSRPGRCSVLPDCLCLQCLDDLPCDCPIRRLYPAWDGFTRARAASAPPPPTWPGDRPPPPRDPDLHWSRPRPAEDYFEAYHEDTGRVLAVRPHGEWWEWRVTYRGLLCRRGHSRRGRNADTLREAQAAAEQAAGD